MSLAQFEGRALVFNNGVVDVQQNGVSVVDENKVAHITTGGGSSYTPFVIYIDQDAKDAYYEDPTQENLDAIYDVDRTKLADWLLGTNREPLFCRKVAMNNLFFDQVVNAGLPGYYEPNLDRELAANEYMIYMFHRDSRYGNGPSEDLLVHIDNGECIIDKILEA